MDQTGEANGGTEDVPPDTSQAESEPSEVHEFYHSLFAGISTIWPESVCGH